MLTKLAFYQQQSICIESVTLYKCSKQHVRICVSEVYIYLLYFKKNKNVTRSLFKRNPYTAHNVG